MNKIRIPIQKIGTARPPRAMIVVKFGEQSVTSSGNGDTRQVRSVKAFDHVRLVTGFQDVAEALRMQWPDAAARKLSDERTHHTSYVFDLPRETIVPILIDPTHSSVGFERREGSMLTGVCDGTTYRDLGTRTTRACSCTNETTNPCVVSNRINGQIVLSTSGTLHSVWLSSHSRSLAQELASLPETDDLLLVGVQVTERRGRRIRNGKVEVLKGNGPALAYCAPVPPDLFRELLSERRSQQEWTAEMIQMTHRLTTGLLRHAAPPIEDATPQAAPSTWSPDVHAEGDTTEARVDVGSDAEEFDEDGEFDDVETFDTGDVSEVDEDDAADAPIQLPPLRPGRRSTSLRA